MSEPVEPLRVELRKYLYAAVEELGIDTRPDQGSNSKPLERDMRRWFIERWGQVARAVFGGKSLQPETIEDLLRGSYDIQHVNLQITHSVLQLSDYSLTVDATWKAPSETKLRHTVDEFRVLLRDAREKHRDPLHLLRQRVNPAFLFPLAIAAWPDSVVENNQKPELPQALVFRDEVDNSGPSPSDKLKVPKGSLMALQVVPRVEGRLLLLSWNADGKVGLVLNETFDWPRNAILPGNRIHTMRASKPAEGTTGERELIAIYWPATRDVGAASLQPLFDGSSSKLKVDDLRRLAGEVFATAALPDDQRVSAAIIGIELG